MDPQQFLPLRYCMKILAALQVLMCTKIICHVDGNLRCLMMYCCKELCCRQSAVIVFGLHGRVARSPDCKAGNTRDLRYLDSCLRVDRPLFIVVCLNEL